MPKQKTVDGYSERNYKQSKNLYDSIAQAFEDVKYEHSSNHGWNLLSEKVDGLTIKLIGEDSLAITYHRIEVTTVEGLARLEDDGSKFIGEVVKNMKKKFRKNTGKTLNLKKVDESRAVEKHSRMQADTSWMLGSSRYGYGARPTGRFLVKDSIVYEFDVDLLG